MKSGLTPQSMIVRCSGMEDREGRRASSPCSLYVVLVVALLLRSQAAADSRSPAEHVVSSKY